MLHEMNEKRDDCFVFALRSINIEKSINGPLHWVSSSTVPEDGFETVPTPSELPPLQAFLFGFHRMERSMPPMKSSNPDLYGDVGDEQKYQDE
jgi:hypothetical protein